jgi:hypothetical protein
LIADSNRGALEFVGASKLTTGQPRKQVAAPVVDWLYAVPPSKPVFYGQLIYEKGT